MALAEEDPWVIEELKQFESPDCAVIYDYHGFVPAQLADYPPKFLIYSCFGEAFDLAKIENLTERFGQSFIILLTARLYPNIPHHSNRYRILRIPSIYAWYGRTIPDLPSALESRRFTKHFLSLNNRAAWPRQALAQFVVQQGLLDRFYLSYRCDDRDDLGMREVYDQINSHIGRCWFNDRIDFDAFFSGLPMEVDDFYGNDWSFGQPDFYNNSFASVVNETYINQNWDPFFTEKIFKPLAYGHPFLVFSSAGALRLLRDLGFETFGDVFDESYDDIESPQRRFEHILRQVQGFCERPLGELQEIFQGLLPRLQHNQQVLRVQLQERYAKDIKAVAGKIRSVLENPLP